MGHTSKVTLTMREDSKNKPAAKKDKPAPKAPSEEPPAKRLVQRARKQVHHDDDDKVRLQSTTLLDRTF